MKTIKEELEYIKNRNELLSSLMRYAESDGFIKVESDIFEGLVSFMNTNNRYDINELIKLEDQKGELFILRPDITTNIIKQVIPRISKDDELKLYYLDNIFSYNQNGDMSSKRQFGVEMIGGDSFEKEVELLSFIEGLLDAYQMSYYIEIGNQKFIEVLINELSENMQKKSMIKDALMRKNVTLLKSSIEADNRYFELLLMTLDPIVKLDEIKKFLINHQLNKRLLDEMNRTMDITKKMNQDNITIDLSLISPYDYYNGPIFKGYIEGYNKDIFRGGRYDTLTENYGTLTKALGFSLDLTPFMKEVL